MLPAAGGLAWNDRRRKDRIEWLEEVHHVHAAADPTEGREAPIEVRLPRVRNEELAVLRVERAKVGHPHYTGLERKLCKLGSNREAWFTGPVPRDDVARLRHEVREYAVKRHPIVMPVQREPGNGLHGERRLCSQQLEGYSASRRFQDQARSVTQSAQEPPVDGLRVRKQW